MILSTINYVFWGFSLNYYRQTLKLEKLLNSDFKPPKTDTINKVMVSLIILIPLIANIILLIDEEQYMANTPINKLFNILYFTEQLLFPSTIIVTIIAFHRFRVLTKGTEYEIRMKMMGINLVCLFFAFLS